MTSVLEARGLVVLREGRRILDGASILVRPGEAVAIQGASGSGKSTFARALATLVEPDAGTVLHDDHAITITEEESGEARFVTTGLDALGRVLVVVYTWRAERARVISARLATPRERRKYEGAR